MVGCFGVVLHDRLHDRLLLVLCAVNTVCLRRHRSVLVVWPARRDQFTCLTGIRFVYTCAPAWLSRAPIAQGYTISILRTLLRSLPRWRPTTMPRAAKCIGRRLALVPLAPTWC